MGRTDEPTYWELPNTVRLEGETMRQTAERAVMSLCGDQIQFKVLGNAPLSFYKYKYSQTIQATLNKTGAKVFLFKAYLEHGYHDEVPLQGAEDVEDLQWASLNEMERSIRKDAYKALKNMLCSYT